MIGGLEVRTSLALTEPTPTVVDVPCGGGWRKRVTRVLELPRKDALVFGGALWVHPAMLPALREMAK